MTGPMHILLAQGGAGVVKPTIVLSAAGSGGAVVAGLRFELSGDLTPAGSGSSATPPYWYYPPGPDVGANHSISMHINSGALPDAGGPVDQSLSLSTARSWWWTQSAVGTKTSNATASIYYLGNLVMTTTFNVTAQRIS